MNYSERAELLNRKLFYSYKDRFTCRVSISSGKLGCSPNPNFTYKFTGCSNNSRLNFNMEFNSFEEMEEFIMKNLFKDELREEKLRELGI